MDIFFQIFQFIFITFFVIGISIILTTLTVCLLELSIKSIKNSIYAYSSKKK